MKRYIYPAILYTDMPGSGYVISVSDLGLVMEGETPEEAFDLMKEYMEGYFDCALSIETDIPEATSYAKMAKAKTNNTVLMLDVKVDSGRVM